MQTKEINWLEVFKEIPDFRNMTNSFSCHNLCDILTIALLGCLCGAENDEEIATFGNEKKEFLSQFLALPHGIPSHDTFTRVFRNLDAKAFGDCLIKNSKNILDFIDEYQLAIDGKVLRGTDEKGAKKSGICILTAWATDQLLVLGQSKIEAKSCEKTAVPELLKELDLKDAVVTIDAIGNYPSNAKIIIDKQGSYIFALKKNQKIAYERVKIMMDKYLKEGRLKSNKTYCKDSGRIETRTCYVCDYLEFMDELYKWEGIKSVIMIVSRREINGVVTEETRYYISSIKKTPEYFNTKIRNHWSIENKLHWHLDMSFDEDRCKTRKDNGAENHNTLRKMTLQILTAQVDKHSIKERRKKAGWNDKYLLELLKNVDF